MPIICFPHSSGSGGPGSFQIRFEKEIQSNGWTVKYKGQSVNPDIIFIVGGTKSLFWLFWMKLRGVPIIYRLDGISWLHRKKKVGLMKFLLAEYRNWNCKVIHAFLADIIVYQSSFVRKWWDKKGWRKRKNFTVIYNGISMRDDFSENKRSNYPKRLVVLEGTIDYSPYAIDLLNDLATLLPDYIEIELYGGFEVKKNRYLLNERVIYKGFLPRTEVNKVLSDSVYLSLDINPACPNTVIEALSCGAPVVAFDTGSLKELVPPEAGIIVPYGSDPWQLGYPDVEALVEAIVKIKENYSYYSDNARIVAEERYSIERMKEKYIFEINRLIVSKR